MKTVKQYPILILKVKKKPLYCSIHKKENMIDVKNKKCIFEKCKKQPFFNNDNSVICIYNGEIYNFEEFGNSKSDGECLIPLYEKYGNVFISKLDGEFAVCLIDFNNNKLILSSDIFGTKPLWIGFDGKKFGISTYKSCLKRINLSNNFQILANKTYIIDFPKNKSTKVYDEMIESDREKIKQKVKESYNLLISLNKSN